MKSKKIAAIDIGTNTILMLIAKVYENKEFEIISDEHSLARLGEKTANTKIICDAAILRAKDILNKYKNLCISENVDHIEAVGTSALRDAENSINICKQFKEILGNEVKVIPGKEEARLSFLGTVEDNNPSIVIDIGGGSTEIIFGKNEAIENVDSLNIGAVRVTEKFIKNMPVEKLQINDAIAFIQENLTTIDISKYNGKLYTVAGTPTTLAAVAMNLNEFNRSKVHGYILQQVTIDNILNQFYMRNAKQIAEDFNIQPLRADVITAGTLILSEILKYFNRNEAVVSARGLRYGVLKNFVNNYIF